MNYRIYNNVFLGNDCCVHDGCIIGFPRQGEQDGTSKTILGDGCTIRPYTTIYAGSVLGARVQTGHYTFIREDNVIGDDVSVGTNTVLEIRNRIGHRVRIHSACFLEDVTVEDDVFIGPGVVFTDDKYPPNPQHLERDGGATVRKGARIGAHCTILPGVEIGEGALVGAGAIVTKNVPAYCVVYGNPARVVRDV